MLRCSAHSVRPVTPTERLHHELHSGEDPTRWKTLTDIVPRREYEDITIEVPGEEDTEVPDLPEHPDGTTTLIPRRRAFSKMTHGPDDLRPTHRTDSVGVIPSSNKRPPMPFGLGNPEASLPMPLEHPMSPSSLLSRPASPRSAPVVRPAGEAFEDGDVVNDYSPSIAPQTPPETSDKRRWTTDYDLRWVEQLEHDAFLEQQEFTIYDAMMDSEDCLSITFDIEAPSHRQQKALERNPILFLVRKMANSEVTLHKLSEGDRHLFERAKAKEVQSFLKNEAVRKCLNQEEIREAYGSGRIVKARWVLTWKLVPPEETEDSKKDSVSNPQTLNTKDGKRKAKARIVLLGFQHPSLLDPSFKTSAPVQSMIGRNLIYLPPISTSPMEARRTWSSNRILADTADRGWWETLDIRSPGIERSSGSRFRRYSQDSQEHLWINDSSQRTLVVSSQDIDGVRRHCSSRWKMSLGMVQQNPKRLYR